MKKQIRSMGVSLSLTTAAVLIAGCGGEYSTLSGDNSISGGAVSASAVSGQAVSDSGGYGFLLPQRQIYSGRMPGKRRKKYGSMV